MHAAALLVRISINALRSNRIAEIGDGDTCSYVTTNSHKTAYLVIVINH